MIDVKRVDTEKMLIGEIKNFKTRELVEELKKRAGVEAHTAEPDKGLNIDVEGPAIVLVITD